jgi:hypothetical protein
VKTLANVRERRQGPQVAAVELVAGGQVVSRWCRPSRALEQLDRYFVDVVTPGGEQANVTPVARARRHVRGSLQDQWFEPALQKPDRGRKAHRSGSDYDDRQGLEGSHQQHPPFCFDPFAARGEQPQPEPPVDLMLASSAQQASAPCGAAPPQQPDWAALPCDASGAVVSLFVISLAMVVLPSCCGGNSPLPTKTGTPAEGRKDSRHPAGQHRIYDARAHAPAELLGSTFKMRTNSAPFAHIALLATLLVAACSGSQSDITMAQTAGASSTGGTETGPGSGTCMPTASSVQNDVFKASCDGAGCHGSQNPAVGLNLVDTSLDKLMGTSSALCIGWSLIVPGSPEKSFLYQKLTASMPACGEAMPLGKHLSDASAQCVADWIKGMGAAGGCETCGGKDCVALASDAAHCGACDNVCPAGVACENGACSCPAGAQACGGSCVDVSKDVQNCGNCGNACGAGSSCEGGQCTCPSSLKACGATCADLQSDPKNCGACGTACSAGQVCLTGKCAAGCGSLTQCGASCVDTQTSLLSCGGCDQPCAVGLTCAGGKWAAAAASSAAPAA